MQNSINTELLDNNNNVNATSKPLIIGLNGLMGSGKSTVAKILEKHGFVELSFANVLKDIVSLAFDWPRELLQGETEESRVWREKVDIWWATKLHIPYLTPRWVLQNWGTEVIRNHFHTEFWIASLERKILNKGYTAIVLSDCRFDNEIKFVQENEGYIYSKY